MNAFENVSLDQALARAGDGVTVVAADGRIVLWNRSAERILGYSAREVTGRACCDIFMGRDDNDNRICYQGCHMSNLVKLGEPVQHFEMRTETKTGQRVWLDVSILSVPYGERNNGSLMVHFFRDITATKELLTTIHERLSGPPGRDLGNGETAVLTRRELEVLRLVATGLNTKGIADQLHVSPATVRNHVQNILGKLSAHNRLEAVAYATRHRLL